MSPSWKLGLAAVGLVAATSFAAAQVTPGRMGMMDSKGPMQDHHRMMKEMMHRA